MASTAFARIARVRLVTSSAARFRPTVRVAQILKPTTFSIATAQWAAAGHDIDAHDPHHEESFEEFTARYDCFSCISHMSANGQRRVSDTLATCLKTA